MLRIVQASTESFLSARFGGRPCTQSTSQGSSDQLDRFIIQWKNDHLTSPAVRHATCAELFFRLCRFPEAKRHILKAAALLEADPHCLPEQKGHYFMAAARTCIELASYREAQQWLERLGPLARRLSPGLRARYLHHKGFVAYKLKRFEQAMVHFRKAYRSARRHRLPFIAGSALHDEGAVWQDLGRYPKALECYRASIPLSAKAGDIRHVSWSKFQIGVVRYLQGRFGRARKWYEASLEIAERIPDLNHVSVCQHDLGLLEFLGGKLPQAIQRFNRCIELSKLTGQGEWTGMDWQHIGVCWLDDGDLRQADRCFRNADRLYVAAGDHSTRSELCSYRAAWALEQDDLRCALDFAKRAVRFGQRPRMPEYLSRACFMLGLVRLRMGGASEAKKLTRRGLGLAKNIPGVLLELAFCAARYGGRRATVACDPRLLRWAQRVYRRLGNRHRAAAIQKAVSMAAEGAR